MSKLTWEKGKNASWEGVEMTDATMMKRFGCLEVLYDNGDNIVGYITDKSTYRVGNTERDVILNIINDYTTEKFSYSYDNELDEAHGFSKEHTKLIIDDVIQLVIEIKNFILISKIPNSVKVKECEEFMDAIDEYFDNNNQFKKNKE